MTVYFSVIPPDQLEWAQQEAKQRAYEDDLIERGRANVADILRRRGLRRSRAHLTRRRVKELLAEVS